MTAGKRLAVEQTVDLRAELPPAHDRAGDQLAEKKLEQREARQGSEWLSPAAGQVDQERRQLENVERDSERDNDIAGEQIEASRRSKEYSILEIGQASEIDDQSRKEPPAI